MDIGPIIKWQIEIGRGTEVPFECGIYSIALRAISFQCPDVQNTPKVIHVCTDPNVLGGSLWIGTKLRGACVRSILTGGSRDISAEFSINNLEKHVVTLAYANRVAICVYDHEGALLTGTGCCIFDVIVDRCAYQ